MKSFIHKATELTPEIILSPEENMFIITGRSAPEDVRSLYYPIIEWMEGYADELSKGHAYTEKNPLLVKIDLEYFNSSSAKFLYDVFAQLKDLNRAGVPVDIEWYFEDEDIDLREAGEDLSLLCELPFKFCPKSK